MKKAFFIIISLVFAISGCASASAAPRDFLHKPYDKITITASDLDREYEILGPVKAGTPNVPLLNSINHMHNILKHEAVKIYKNVDAIIKVRYGAVTFPEGILDIETVKTIEGVAVKLVSRKSDVEALRRDIIPAISAATKGGRLLSIDITKASDDDYNRAFDLAKNAGSEFVQLSLGWADIETAPGNYGNPFLGIANSYYPSRSTGLALMIGPIDTNNNRMPPDLKTRRFDDPEITERFKRLIDYVLSQLKDTDIVSFSVGNEIDAYFGADRTKWSEYEAFYKISADYIRSKRPDIKVGAKATLPGLTGAAKAYLKSLNESSDVVMATYYPLNPDFSVKDPVVVKDDLGLLVSIYGDKDIYLLETGYPSGSLCGSSERKQEEFIHEIFRAWDAYQANIKLINFVWLHDKSDAEVNSFSSYYGIASAKFREYLRTLGLRTNGGADKPAFGALKDEAKSRGW